MSEAQEKRNRKYFNFLIHKYGFEYHGYEEPDSFYVSDKFIIKCYVGRRTPSMIFRQRFEPDYIITELGFILEALGIIQNDKYDDNMSGGVKENAAYMKSMFAKAADAIINQPDTWWLDAQKLGFKRTEEIFRETIHLYMNSESLKRFYQYIKSKDPDWNSTIQFPDDWNP